MKKLFNKDFSISTNQLILIIALFWSLFANNSFYKALLHDYPFNAEIATFLASVIFGAFSLIVLVLGLICVHKATKPILIFLLISSASLAYFMDIYNVMINTDIVRNSMMTDNREVYDLLSIKLFIYVLLLGIIPAWFVWRLPIKRQTFAKALFHRTRLLLLLLIINLATFLYHGAAFASFFREHHSIRYYANPANYIYAVTKVMVRSFQSSGVELTKIGEDAHFSRSHDKRKLVIMVAGETVRDDRFSLNGYARETNPLLASRALVSFKDVTSCGTSTNVSLPCMFSNLGEQGYDAGTAKNTEDLLDVLHHAGVKVLWRDNNSSSKGVADRVEYVDFREPNLNKVCDEECRDVGMLGGLQQFIDTQKSDIFIVLHQMGNHGPAYYKRYPKEFEKFKPTCQTNDLNACSIDEINNAYDNAILYTDYFLDETIKLLEKNDDEFEVAMVYLGDHGESLGENGLYLHGVPNFIAPKEQRKVPFIIWYGEDFKPSSVAELQQIATTPVSHDNLFHTMLGMMQIDSQVYNSKLDLTRQD
jgi:lipid A ethanolaminephosphotransferase